MTNTVGDTPAATPTTSGNNPSSMVRCGLGARLLRRKERDASRSPPGSFGLQKARASG